VVVGVVGVVVVGVDVDVVEASNSLLLLVGNIH
jgi:hypothetical protein